jgi:hypothetical protein
VPDEHARFSPSSSTRWLACPFTLAGEQAPNKDSVFTVRGTAMHDRSEQHLKAWTDPREDRTVLTYPSPDDPKRELQMTAEEWQPHVIAYVEGVRALYDEAELMGYKPQLAIEERYDIVSPDCWGTADATLIVPGEVLDVADLKTGKGHIVPANTAQFKTYAVGACIKYGWDFKEVRLHRSQIAASVAWDTFVISCDELKDHLKVIKKAIKATQKIDELGGEPNEGCINDECCWCMKVWPDGNVGQRGCPAHINRTLQVLEEHDAKLDKDGKLKMPEPHEIPVDKLAWLAFHRAEIVGWFNALDTWMTQEAINGREFIGFKLVEGRSNRKWNPELSEEEIVEAILETAEMLEVAVDPYETKLASFTKVEKALGKKSVDHLVVKPPGKMSLVTEDDHRASINALSILNDGEV